MWWFIDMIFCSGRYGLSDLWDDLFGGYSQLKKREPKKKKRDYSKRMYYKSRKTVNWEKYR